jgi:hypothetical protein
MAASCRGDVFDRGQLTVEAVGTDLKVILTTVKTVLRRRAAARAWSVSGRENGSEETIS